MARKRRPIDPSFRSFRVSRTPVAPAASWARLAIAKHTSFRRHAAAAIRSAVSAMLRVLCVLCLLRSASVSPSSLFLTPKLTSPRLPSLSPCAPRRDPVETRHVAATCPTRPGHVSDRSGSNRVGIGETDRWESQRFDGPVRKEGSKGNERDRWKKQTKDRTHILPRRGARNHIARGRTSVDGRELAANPHAERSFEETNDT